MKASRLWAAAASQGSSSSARPPSTLRRLLAQAPSDEAGPVPTTIQATVKSLRVHSKVSFLNLSDGSLGGDSTLQAVLKNTVALHEAQGKALTPGAAVRLTGQLQASKGRSQALEFVVTSGSVVAGCDAKRHPFMSMAASGAEPSNTLARRHAHLRSQIPSFAATLRLRARMEAGMSAWLDAQGYTRVQPPIMTSSDCEGGGEVFQVVEPTQAKETDEEEGAAVAVTTPTYLSVSSQLHLEALMLGLGPVYTFSPAFRAEESATNRHLREFWMCEVELPTISSKEAEELDEIIGVVEGSIKAGAKAALGTASGEELDTATCADVEYLYGEADGELDEMKSYIDQPWSRMTYSEAIETLQRDHASIHGDATSAPPPPTWGDSLSSDHERYLATHIAKGPLFITNYPSNLKPFYMRTARDEQSREVALCFDLVVPRLGELVGGSLREDDVEKLKSRQLRGGASQASPTMAALNAWYVDSLRSSGMPPHGGFGVGIERLVAWLANRESVRDVSAFPRVGRQSVGSDTASGTSRWQY